MTPRDIISQLRNIEAYASNLKNMATGLREALVRAGEPSPAPQKGLTTEQREKLLRKLNRKNQ